MRITSLVRSLFADPTRPAARRRRHGEPRTPRHVEGLESRVLLSTVSLVAADPVAAETAGTAVNAGTFVFTRTGDVSAPLTVNYTVGGTATSGADYTALPGTLTFDAGQRVARLAVTPLSDALAEGNETVTVALAPAGAGEYDVGARASGTVTIRDNAPTISVVTSRPVASEALAGKAAGNGVFTLRRTGPLTDALTVAFTLTGTAENGTDYAAVPESVTFAPGKATATVTVAPVDDGAAEGNETVVLTLAQDAGPSYLLNAKASKGTVTIRDSAPTVAVAVVGNVIANGGRGARLRFSRTGPTYADPLTVNYTLGGTAGNGTDYSALPGTFTFNAGQSVGFVDVTPTAGDTGGSKTVVVTLDPGAAYTLAPQPTRQSARVTITNAAPFDFFTGTGLASPGTYSYFATSGNQTVNAATITTSALGAGAGRLAIAATGPAGAAATSRTYDLADDGTNVVLVNRGVTLGGAAGTLFSPTLVLAPSNLAPGTYTATAPTTLNLGAAGFGTGTTTARTTYTGVQSVSTPVGVFDADRVDILLTTNVPVTFDPGTAVTQQGQYTSTERLTLWVVPTIGIVRASIVTNESAPFITSATTGLPLNTSTAYTASLFSYTANGTTVTAPGGTGTGTGVGVGTGTGTTTGTTGIGIGTGTTTGSGAGTTIGTGLGTTTGLGTGGIVTGTTGTGTTSTGSIGTGLGTGTGLDTGSVGTGGTTTTTNTGGMFGTTTTDTTNSGTLTPGNGLITTIGTNGAITSGPGIVIGTNGSTVSTVGTTGLGTTSGTPGTISGLAPTIVVTGNGAAGLAPVAVGNGGTILI